MNIRAYVTQTTLVRSLDSFFLETLFFLIDCRPIFRLVQFPEPIKGPGKTTVKAEHTGSQSPSWAEEMQVHSGAEKSELLRPWGWGESLREEAAEVAILCEPWLQYLRLFMISNTKAAAKRIWEEGHLTFSLTTGSRVFRT